MSIMRNISILFLLLFTRLLSYSQENTTPIKYGINQDSISQDSVFSNFINKLNINISEYKIVNILDIVNYSDSINSKKISNTIRNIKINYLTLKDFNIDKILIYKNFNNSTNKKNKLLMCNRTLIPDDKNKYTVTFYSLE